MRADGKNFELTHRAKVKRKPDDLALRIEGEVKFKESAAPSNQINSLCFRLTPPFFMTNRSNNTVGGGSRLAAVNPLTMQH